MIAEGNPRRDFGAGCLQQAEEFLWPRDAGESDDARALHRFGGFASGAKRAARIGLFARAAMSRPRSPSPIDDQHIRRRKLRIERRAQRPGRDAAAIARAIVRVDGDERQVGRDATAVEAVVENDDGGAEALRQVCARKSVCADDRRRDARKQQRFVADSSAP